MSLVFLGTPAFAVPSLESLARQEHRIAAVVTQPDRPAGRSGKPRPSPVKSAAETLGLPVFQPDTLRDVRVVEHLRRLVPEVMVVVAYGEILRQNVLDIPANGVLNAHASLLPRWRGASPIPAAILAGDSSTGVSIMLMDAGMDSGPLLAQTKVVITDEDTTLSLTHTLANQAADLLSEALPRWLSGKLDPQPQDDELATYCPLLKKEDGAIDWDLPAVEIWRRVRAHNPWPGAYAPLSGDQLQIWRAWPLDDELAAESGTIMELPEALRAGLPEQARDDAAFAIQTGGGVLVPLEVQRAGRRRVSAVQFMRGMRIIVGRRLGSPAPA